MTAEDPRLTQIRALAATADGAASRRGRVTPEWVRAVRKILAAAPVDVTPPQGIDRDALVSYLDSAYAGVMSHHQAVADRILALVRPVEGYVLTPEERGDVVQALRFEAATIVPDGGDPATADRMRSLAARLREAAQ